MRSLNPKIYSQKFAQPIELLLVIGMMLLAFLLIFNFLNFHHGQWFLHPDERDAYVHTKLYADTGSFSYNNNLNTQYSTNAFTPDGSVSIGSKVVPALAMGIFILLGPSFAFGSSAVFFIVPICACIALLFSYLLLKRHFGRRFAFVATILFAFTPNYIFWSNMLFSNVPALMFFMIGIYLADGTRAKPLSGLFLGWAILLRYEYILVVGIYLITALILNKGKNIRTIVAIALVMLPMILIIPFENQKIYGNMTSNGYTQKAYDRKSHQVVNFGESKGGIIGGFQKIIHRAGGPLTEKNAGSNLYKNSRQYVFDLTPFLLLFAGVGLFKIKSRISRQNKTILISLIFIGAFLFIYFGTAGGYNGFSRGWLASSYTRYMLLMFFPLSILATLGLSFTNVLKKNQLLVAFLSIYIVSSFWFAKTTTLGLDETLRQKSTYAYVNKDASALPGNSIVVTNFYSKAIVSKPVFTASNLWLSGDPTANDVVPYIDKLLANGKNVYVFENPNHTSYLHLEDRLTETKHRITIIDNTMGFYKVSRG
jgi:hypothetical protein